MVSLSAPANFHQSGEFPSAWVFNSWAPAPFPQKKKCQEELPIAGGSSWYQRSICGYDEATFAKSAALTGWTERSLLDESGRNPCISLRSDESGITRPDWQIQDWSPEHLAARSSGSL